jgi:serine/threonine-protein kinase
MCLVASRLQCYNQIRQGLQQTSGLPGKKSKAMSERGPPLRLQDRYRLAEYLGEGGAGIVYRAHDEMLDRDVAVKFLRPERLAGEAARTRFLREARLVARLSDPNIVTLHDVGTEGQWLYLVLEHILGHDLRAVLAEREGRLSVPQALHIVRGILNALVCAHGQGIIHRDIKPENVMVDVDGQVKVTDLGLALAVEGARCITSRQKRSTGRCPTQARISMR